MNSKGKLPTVLRIRPELDHSNDTTKEWWWNITKAENLGKKEI